MSIEQTIARPRHKMPIGDYLSVIEFRLTKIIQNYSLLPAAETEITEVIMELRMRAYRLKQDELKLLQEGKHPCQQAQSSSRLTRTTPKH